MDTAMNPTTEFGALLDLLAMLLREPRSALLIGLLLAAAWTDYRAHRIPNPLALGGMLAGLALAALAPPFHVTPQSALLSALAGLGCGLAALLPFYLMRAMGAGDVKLMGMCGAFLGYPDIVFAVLATFLAGGLLALGYLAWRGGLRRAIGNIGAMTQDAALGAVVGTRPTLALAARDSAGTLPYGIAIAMGTIGYLVLRQIGVISL